LGGVARRTATESGARDAPAWTRTVVAATGRGGGAAATATAGAAWAAPSAGWISAAAIYLGWTWAVILPMNSRSTAAHATREDSSRAVFDLLLVGACVASLGAIVLLLLHGSAADPAARDLTAGLALCSVAASWAVAHTVYTLRYARLYYGRAGHSIDFNQEHAPRYRDFAYMAFTIGMTYQVSDTNVRTPDVRATVLRHGLLSFLLGAVVLATTVNLVASLGR
jgi:uncharacterized membrane protein